MARAAAAHKVNSHSFDYLIRTFEYNKEHTTQHSRMLNRSEEMCVLFQIIRSSSLLTITLSDAGQGFGLFTIEIEMINLLILNFKQKR